MEQNQTRRFVFNGIPEKSSVPLLPKIVRNLLWEFCALFRVNIHGIPGQACRTLERYVLEEFRTIAGTGTERRMRTMVMLIQLPLRIVSCIQLCTKMYCTGYQIRATDIIDRCRQIFPNVTIEILNLSEAHVFRKIGYHVPLWSSLEEARSLASDVGVPLAAIEMLDDLLDYAEYIRDKLDTKIRSIINTDPLCTRFKDKTVHIAHLCGGCVAACQRFSIAMQHDYVPQIAERLEVPESYIRCIKNLIVQEFVTNKLTDSSSSSEDLAQEPHEEPAMKKRRQI